MRWREARRWDLYFGKGGGGILQSEVHHTFPGCLRTSLANDLCVGNARKTYGCIWYPMPPLGSLEPCRLGVHMDAKQSPSTSAAIAIAFRGPKPSDIHWGGGATGVVARPKTLPHLLLTHKLLLPHPPHLLTPLYPAKPI